MWKKIIAGVLIAGVIAGVIYWLTYTKELHTPVSEAINAIPGNAAVIIESRQMKDAWKKLSGQSVWWESLLETESFKDLNKSAEYVDSILTKEPQVAQLLMDHSMFVSAHVSGAASFDFLFVYSLPNRTYQHTLDDFFKRVNKHPTSLSKEYAGTSITVLYPNVATRDSLCYALVDGILMMSKKEILVREAVRQLKSGVSLLKDKNFSKIVSTVGKNVDASVYINYKNFPGIVSLFSNPLLQREVNDIPDFADCSTWDVSIKPNGLLLSGFTQANDSSARFLNIFRKQKPQEMELVKVIPSKTALLLFEGISNIRVFHRDYKNYLSATQQLRLQSMEHYIEGIEKKYNVSLEHYMLEWIDGEMAFVVTESSSDDFENNSFAVMHSDNVEESFAGLNELASIVNAGTKTNNGSDEKAIEEAIVAASKKEILEYRGHLLGYINLPQLLPQLFGWTFKPVHNSYFTAIDEYIVFGNSRESLKSFIDEFENKKVLVNDKNYKAFAENISTETNLYFYTSLARSANVYNKILQEEYAKSLDAKRDVLFKFQAAAFQFSINETNKLFYSNAYLRYNPLYKQESGTLWELELDTAVSSKPYLVVNHNTQAMEICVQDDANKLYLINSAGKILWMKQLPEKIISDIVQVDALKNNKLQLLFNTRNAIYMFDRNGKEMRGFPLKLKSPASSALSVFDYEKNRDYRIFVSCNDKKIHCFKVNGEVVDGFEHEAIHDVIKHPLQYQRIGEKDYLIAVDNDGHVYVFNRKGETIVKIKEKLPLNASSSYYIEQGKDYAKTSVVAVDSIGKLKKVYFNGEKEEINIEEFKAPVYFSCRDINNDNVKEFVYAAENKLVVYAKSGTKLFEHNFDAPISHAPQFFDFGSGEIKIGVVIEGMSEVYLFNSDGSLYPSFPLTGKTCFEIDDLNHDGKRMLVTGGGDKSIYVYQLQEVLNTPH